MNTNTFYMHAKKKLALIVNNYINQLINNSFFVPFVSDIPYKNFIFIYIIKVATKRASCARYTTVDNTTAAATTNTKTKPHTNASQIIIISFMIFMYYYCDIVVLNIFDQNVFSEKRHFLRVLHLCCIYHVPSAFLCDICNAIWPLAVLEDGKLWLY